MENNSLILNNGLHLVIDWISFTVTASMAVENVIQFMGFSSALFTEMPRGSNGYKHMKKYEDISVLYDGFEDMGIHVNISGGSVATLLNSFKETLSVSDSPFGVAYDLWNDDVFSRFCKEVLEIGSFTRIDIAIDDLGCNFYSMDELLSKLKNNLVVTRFRKYKNNEECAIGGEKTGHTIYLGSRQSPIMFRVYDKKLEQNKNLTSDDENYCIEEWVRWEMELHKERSNEFATLLLQNTSISDISVGILTYYIRIIQNDDANRSRCSNEPKWDAFIDGIEKLRLTAPKREKTMYDKENWIEEQVAPTLALITLARGGDLSYIENLVAKNTWRISEKDKQLLRDADLETYEQFTEDEV